MDKVDIIDLEGDAYARGLALGRARRARVQVCLSEWLESLRAAGVADPTTYLAGMLRATRFEQSVREHAADLLEEVRGLADGSEQPFDLLFTAQLMDEEWAYRANWIAPTKPLEKCSSAAVKGPDGAVLIGQNMDLGGYTDGHQIALRTAPHAAVPGALIFSISSMIALFGVNTQRIGVCVNSLPQLPAASRGLPVAFMIRKLLQARTLAEAVTMVTTIEHATGQHYLIADADNIRSFEASHSGVVEYHPADPSRALHTNHPLAASPVETWVGGANSVARLEALTNRLASGRPDLESVKAALASRDHPEHPVSRIKDASARQNALTGMISFTTGSMISVLRRTSQDIDAWISPGPPSLCGYTRFTFRN